MPMMTVRSKPQTTITIETEATTENLVELANALKHRGRRTDAQQNLLQDYGNLILESNASLSSAYWNKYPEPGDTAGEE